MLYQSILAFFRSIEQFIAAPFEALSTALVQMLSLITFTEPVVPPEPLIQIDWAEIGASVAGWFVRIGLKISSFFGSLMTPGMRVFLLFSGALLLIATFVGWCLMYKKAGRPWESMFVPIYGFVGMYGIADCEVILWANLVAAFIFIPINAIPALAVTLIITQIVFSFSLARAFGKSAGFAIGLLLLQPVFIIILGVDKSKYIFGSAGSRK